MCFSETLNAAGELLTVGNSLCMRVVASEDDGGGMKFRAESFEDLDAVAARTGTGLKASRRRTGSASGAQDPPRRDRTREGRDQDRP